MKYFSKLLSMFLVGMVLVSVGCTDYDEQIRDLHNKIDQNQTDMTEKVDAEINALEADLAQVKADLEAALEAMKNELSTKHKEDVDALKAIDAELDGKIAAANEAILALEGELAKEVSRLEGEIDTLEAALEAAKKELADAIKAGDDAVKAELTKKITDLETSLLAKINELQTKLEGDIEDLRTDMQAKVDAANAAIAEANDAIDALDIRVGTLEADVDAIQQDIVDIENEIADTKAALEKAIKDGDAAVKAELEAKIAALESELKAKIAALEAQDKLFAEQLEEIEDNLNALSDRVTANYNELKADLAKLETKLQAQIDANKRAIEENALDIVALQAQAEEIIKSVDNVRNYVVNVEKALIAHMEDFANYQAVVKGEISAINAHLVLLDEQIAAIEAMLPEMQAQIDANKALAQQNAADIAKNAALFNEFKNATLNTLDQLMKADVAINTAIAALADDVDALEGDLAALAADLDAYKTFVEGQLKDCYAHIATVKGDLEASIAALKAQHTKDLTAVLAQTTAIWAQLSEYQNKLNDEIANRKAEDAAILKLLNEKYDNLDEKYDARCNELNDAIVKLEKDFMLYQAEIQAMLSLAIDNLKAEILAAEKRANEYTDVEVGKLKDYTDKKLGELRTDLNSRIDDVEANLKQLGIEFELEVERINTKIDTLNTTLTNRIAALEKLEAEHYGELKKEIADNYNDLKGLIAGINAQLLAVWAECSSIRDLVDDVKNTLQGEIDVLTNNLQTAVFELEFKLLVAQQEIYDTINEKVAELQAQIDELVNRIQSIVPVPQDDLQVPMYALMEPGEVKDLADDQFLSNGAVFSIAYRITPAEAASQIVEYCKKDLSILSFALEDYTRYEVTGKDAPKVMSVTKDEEGTGRIIVKGFVPYSEALDDFYKKGYVTYDYGLGRDVTVTGADDLAVALVFNNEAADSEKHKGNIISVFTPLTPSPVYVTAADLALYYTAEDKAIINGQFTSDQAYYNVDQEGYGKRNEIKYDDAVATATDEDPAKAVILYEGWEPRIKYDGKYYTVETLAKDVFGLVSNSIVNGEEIVQFIPDFVNECEHVYEDGGGLAITYDESNFDLTEDVRSYNDTYRVAKVIKESVGNKAITSLKTSLNGVISAVYGEEVKIIKAYSVVDLGSIQYVWNYADFKKAKDAGKAYRDYVRNFKYQVEDISLAAADLALINEQVTLLPLPEDYYTDAGKTELAGATYTVKAQAYKTDGTLEDTILTGWAFNTPTWTKAGESYTWTFNLNGWDFGKKYQVTAKAELPTLDIIFKFDLDMVALSDAVVAQSETKFEFDASREIYDHKFGSSFALLWEQNEEALKHHFTKDQFVGTSSSKSVFVDDSAYEDGVKYYTLSKNDSTPSTPTSYLSVPSTPGVSYLATDNSNIRELFLAINWDQVDGIADEFDYSTYYTAVFGVDKIKMTNNVHALVKMPEYFVQHSPTYVTADKSVKGAKYTTEVKGIWSPNFSSDAVDGFSTKHVLLPDAFNVYMLVGGIPQSVDPAVKKIDFVFEITGSVEDEFLWTNYKGNKFNAWSEADEASNPDQMNGIALNTADVVVDGKTYGAKKVLAYDGKAAYVFVNGTLRVARYGGGYIEVPAAFKEYNDNYRVVKYDPIAGWHNKPAVLNTADMSADYKYSLFKSVSLVDARTNNVDGKGWELIDHNTTLGIANPWVVGNGYDNGFADTYNAGEVFGMNVTPYGVKFDSEFTTFVSGKSYEDLNLKNNIKLDTTNGTLRFIGVNSMTIYETVDVVVKVTVDYPWGRKVGDIVVTIPANA